ncbi:MAG TPA: SDR family NAD(P)-dependent oxidoreductase [Ramlibacter sp.]
MADKHARPLAVVTGASSGIGYHLARCAVQHGFDLVVAADTPLDEAVMDFRSLGANVLASVQCDLATREGVDKLCQAVGSRAIDVLCANAGHGLGGAFLDQHIEGIQHVINTNITGTIYLIQRAALGMRARGKGRILITGSIAGFQPGAFHAVYNASKAFIDSFGEAMRDELRDTGVTVSILMPGATDTEFFDRAGLQGTFMGDDMSKDAPDKVARAGFEAMMKGEADVVYSIKNKLQVVASKMLPAQAAAAAHRKIAQPGSSREAKKERAEAKKA